MTRIRTRNALGAPDGEYDLVNFTDDAEWVLRDAEGDTFMFEQGPRDSVEVRCDICGRWADDVVPSSDGWWSCVNGCGREEKPDAL